MKRLFKPFGILKGVKLPWVLIVLSLGFSLLTMSAELTGAQLTADVIDTGQKAIDAKTLLSYIGVTAAAAVLAIAGNYFTRKMEETVNLRVRYRLWEKIMHLPARFYDEDNGNELVSRVTSDAAAPSSLFSMAVSFAVCIVTSVQAFMKLYDYNTMLADYSLVIIPLTLAVSLIYGKLMYKLGVYGTVTMAGSLGYLAERVRNFRLIKSAAAERAESIRGNGTFRRMYRAEFLNWLMVAGYQLASGMFSILFIFIIFVPGGQLVRTGELSVGDVTSFYMITGIVSLQLMQFFMNVGSVSGIFGNMKKINRIADAQPEAAGGKPVPPVCSDIRFENVSFAYDEDREALRNISLTIPMGKVTAVIGGNGAGKSTLFKLIVRLYEPTAGDILFGDESIRDFDLTAWRDRFAYVFQKDPLIGGTVRENMVYGLDREVTDEELVAAAKAANCYDCIMEKPGGFDEDVGLGGSNFSGGQAQCISVARAMLRNADFLLLDEATSNLDVTGEALVTDALDKLMKNRTTVMIAHSCAATKNADRVIVMRDGVVEAEGSPAELETTNAYYRLFSKTA